MTHRCEGCATRRAVLTGAGAAGVGVLLGGCATYGEQQGAGAPGAPAAAGAAPGASAGPLAPLADIPVGGGKIFPDQRVVVTQPAAGEVKAFSSTCTHQGCTVSSVADGLIKCACHGSEFSVADGSVKQGPAPRPLPSVSVEVKDDAVVLT